MTLFSPHDQHYHLFSPCLYPLCLYPSWFALCHMFSNQMVLTYLHSYLRHIYIYSIIPTRCNRPWLMNLQQVYLPSGKHTKKLEHHHFKWVNPRTKWPCSIAMLVITRPGIQLSRPVLQWMEPTGNRWKVFHPPQKKTTSVNPQCILN